MINSKSVFETLKKNAMLVVLVLVYIFFMITTGGNIFKPANFKALIDQNAYVYVLGAGMMMCMLTGGNIDLSCGSFVCLLGAIGGLFMVNYGMSTGLAIVLMLLIGIAYGCILGYLIAYINIPPWIATLAGYLAFRGLGTSILSNNSKTGSIAIAAKTDFISIFTGKIFGTKPKDFNWPCMIAGIVAAVITIILIFSTRATKIRKGYVADSFGSAVTKSVLSSAAILLIMWKLAHAGGIPTPLVWVVIVVLIYSFITGKTTLGRHFYVVGGNKEAARMSGVDTNKIMFLAYLNMAFLTSITTMLVLGRCDADRCHQPGHEPDGDRCQLAESRQRRRPSRCGRFRYSGKTEHQLEDPASFLEEKLILSINRSNKKSCPYRTAFFCVLLQEFV